jgi:hypothetical protein
MTGGHQKGAVERGFGFLASEIVTWSHEFPPRTFPEASAGPESRQIVTVSHDPASLSRIGPENPSARGLRATG